MRGLIKITIGLLLGIGFSAAEASSSSTTKTVTAETLAIIQAGCSATTGSCFNAGIESALMDRTQAYIIARMCAAGSSSYISSCLNAAAAKASDVRVIAIQKTCSKQSMNYTISGCYYSELIKIDGSIR